MKITVTWPIAVIVLAAIASLTVLLKTNVISAEQLKTAFPYIMGVLALSPAAAKLSNVRINGKSDPPSAKP